MMRIHDYPCVKCHGTHFWRHKLCKECGGVGFKFPEWLVKEVKAILKHEGK